jgi:hypothetical protein
MMPMIEYCYTSQIRSHPVQLAPNAHTRLPSHTPTSLAHRTFRAHRPGYARTLPPERGHSAARTYMPYQCPGLRERETSSPHRCAAHSAAWNFGSPTLPS